MRLCSRVLSSIQLMRCSSSVIQLVQYSSPAAAVMVMVYLYLKWQGLLTAQVMAGQWTGLAVRS
jgi:hypothetical protein